MEINSITPFLAMAIPLVGVALIYATRNTPNLREGCSLGAATIQFVVVVAMTPAILAGNTLHFTLFPFLPQVSISFRVDALGILLALTASFLWILTVIYSIGYMRALGQRAQTRFYACFAVTLAATMGIAFSANLITLYIFYELLTFVTYPLVTHEGTREAIAAGRRYLFYHLGASIIFMLPAVFLTYIISGTFDFRSGGVFSDGAGGAILVVVYFMFLAGAAKAAIMPLHAWLPNAMVAPVPVSALLHAVAVVNVGVFVIVRVILDVFGPELMQELNLGFITAVIASFTILVASFYTFMLDNLKGILAYSTISQLSYMVLGVALLSPESMTGGIIHIANHSFAKITLFFCAGSIYIAARTLKVSEMGGIARLMPWTAGAFAVGAVGIVGIPPTAGFISKWYLFIGAIQAGQIAFFFVLLMSTLLAAAYYLRIFRRVFLGASEERDEEADQPAKGEKERPIKEVSYFIVVPLALSATVSVVLGIYPNFLLELARLAVP
ncbi:MAG: monovalent cation/H+ antiporter subunit D family protein [Rubrobacteraceae bacterium]